MNAQATFFRDVYFAGETATVTVDAPQAESVSVVYGDSMANLHRDGDGPWSADIPTDRLVGSISWTLFAKYPDGRTTALAHGVFRVRCAGRSKLRDVVEKIDEAIRTWGTNPNRSISVGEIRIDYKSLDDLLAVRAQYVQRVEEEENGRALTGGPRIVEVAFR